MAIVQLAQSQWAVVVAALRRRNRAQSRAPHDSFRSMRNSRDAVIRRSAHGVCDRRMTMRRMVRSRDVRD